MSEQLLPLTIDGIRLTDDNDGLNPQRSPGTGLKFGQGTITLVMGPNGAGKTRLLEMTAGLRFTEEWNISYGDERMWLRGRKSRRRRNPAALLAYGYASQSPEEQLFARSVASELRYVLKPYNLSEQEERRRIAAALHAVGWDHTWLEKDPYAMSGGERRRTALACLFAVPARWLLLDEPTAGLDAAGHELLAEQLRQRAAAGQGILLISHESDWAAALADNILIMSSSGSPRLCGRNDIIAHPEWLSQAGMPIPAWLEIAHEWWKRGMPVDKLWSPADLADVLPVLGRKMQGSAESEGLPEESLPLHADQADQADQAQLPFAFAARAGAAARSKSRLPLFDPRSVWLSYILVSSGIFMQKSWSGTGWSLILVLTAIILFRIPLARWRIPIISFGFFMIMISILSGAGNTAGGGWWNTDAFLVSLQSLARPWLVMLLGLGLPLAITPLRLRRSLEQLFAWAGRVPPWAQRLILTITLLLRFVPILLEEWERFSRIAVARGKAPRVTILGAVGQLRDTAIPFMLALFRLGEHAADALESRGIGTRQPTFIRSQFWKRRDTYLLIGCLLIFGFFWIWAKGLFNFM